MTEKSEALRQTLSGLPLGPDPSIRCCACSCELHDGARLTVVARKPSGFDIWGVGNVWCPECAPDSRENVRPDEMDGESVLVDAELGSLVDTARQIHTPCLLSVEIRAAD